MKKSVRVMSGTIALVALVLAGCYEVTAGVTGAKACPALAIHLMNP